MKAQTRRNGLVDWLSALFEQIAGWSYDHRLIVLFLCLAVLGGSLFFAAQVRQDNSFEAYFDRSDPAYGAFLQFREDFGSDEISYILYEAPGIEHGVWNLEVMERIRDLTEALEDQVPFVDKVTSLANAEFIEGDEDELLVYDALEDFPETQEDLLAFSDRVMSKPFFVDALVSEDRKYAAIVIDMEKSSVDPLDEIVLDPGKSSSDLDNLYPQAANNKIEEILARPEYSKIKFYHTGDVPLNAFYNKTTTKESLNLGLLAFGMIALVLGLFFRKFMGVIGPLAIVALSVVLVQGFMGVMGWSQDLMFIMLPAILTAVGVADAVHVFAEFRTFFAEYNDRRQAVVRTLYLVGAPCLFTSLTTVVGFASMSISPIKAIRHFALYSAVGVAGAFLLSITLFVVFLSLGKRRPAKKPTKAQRASAKGGAAFKAGLDAVSRFNIRRRKLIAAASVLIIVISCLGAARLTVDSSFLNEFSKNVKIRRVTEFADNVMGGSASFSYIFESEDYNGILEPEALAEIEAFQKEAESHGVVIKSNSIADILKDLNRAFHENREEYYILPDSMELGSQYMLLYESSGGDESHDYISSDYQRANVELRCKMVETSKYQALVEDLEEYSLARTGSPVPPPVYTGMGSLWVKLLDYIVRSQIQGFALAFTMIAIMMCLVFGSVRTGLLAMIPNLTPVLVTLGYMGWAGIHLDYVKLLIACVAIGIAVDDTVHLITRYRHEFFTHGCYEKALLPSMREVGRALFITTVVLVCGFMVMAFSEMASLAAFGILVAATVLTALLADFFLLPALVLLVKPFGPEFNPEKD
ncbi:efflux RND transporter permease subunit [Desulfatibacillum aliphaticivorans]|uniref:efflux RND transporter permease subunit n=1 Tax=Desulfatibacillum aliphaticivorans TaxID=218208 RepID=UPI0003FF8F58|nr:MMPL family transporter [Desulfatibacillum aliphaticivorans]